jgi:hypothetical protein
MSILKTLTASLALAPLIGGALAHGSHTAEEIAAEIALRDRIAAFSKRSLDKCSNSAASLALKERAIARRAATAQALREKRGLTNGTFPLASPT